MKIINDQEKKIHSAEESSDKENEDRKDKDRRVAK